jgi:hypothetical protein
MTGKNCQNCGREIGPLEESYSYYGQTICKECMDRLEKLLGDPEITDRDTETEIPTSEERLEKEFDTEFEGSLTSQSQNDSLANSKYSIEEHNPVVTTNTEINEENSKDKKMKRSNIVGQKKLYYLYGLILVVTIILIIDHIQLRQETARLKREIYFVALQAPRGLITSEDIERNVNNLDSKIDDVNSRLDELESKLRRFSGLELSISSLNISTNDLDDKIDDIELTLSLLESEKDQHGKYIKEIMRKIGMSVPWNL